VKLPPYPEYLKAKDRVRIKQTAREALISYKPDFFSLSEQEQNKFRFDLTREMPTSIQDFVINNLALVFTKGPAPTKADLFFNWTTQLIQGVGSDCFYTEMFRAVDSNCKTLFDVDYQHFTYQVSRGSDYHNDRYTSLRWPTSGKLLINDLHYAVKLSSVNYLASDQAMSIAQESIESLIPQKSYWEETDGGLSLTTDYFGLEKEIDKIWDRYKQFINDYLVELDQQLNEDPLAVYVVEPEFKFDDYPHIDLVFHSRKTLENIRLNHFYDDCREFEADSQPLENLIKRIDKPVKEFIHETYQSIFSKVDPLRIEKNKEGFKNSPPETSTADFIRNIIRRKNND
jgi:hypothetical protein